MMKLHSILITRKYGRSARPFVRPTTPTSFKHARLCWTSSSNSRQNSSDCYTRRRRVGRWPVEMKRRSNGRGSSTWPSLQSDGQSASVTSSNHRLDLDYNDTFSLLGIHINSRRCMVRAMHLVIVFILSSNQSVFPAVASCTRRHRCTCAAGSWEGERWPNPDSAAAPEVPVGLCGSSRSLCP
jgi:hypothetical protein